MEHCKYCGIECEIDVYEDCFNEHEADKFFREDMKKFFDEYKANFS